jgi:hypothetical protein
MGQQERREFSHVREILDLLNEVLAEVERVKLHLMIESCVHGTMDSHTGERGYLVPPIVERRDEPPMLY